MRSHRNLDGWARMSVTQPEDVDMVMRKVAGAYKKDAGRQGAMGRPPVEICLGAMPSQAPKIRTKKALATSDGLTISRFTWGMTRLSGALNCAP